MRARQLDPSRLRGGAGRRARALAAGVRALAGRLAGSPSWPVLSGLALGALAVAEVRSSPGRAVTSFDAGDVLLAALSTAPLALRRRSLPVAASVVTAATVLTVTTGAAWTVTGLLAQLWVLQELVARYGPVAAVLAGLAAVAYAAMPFGARRLSGAGAGLLLAAVVAAVALGDARRRQGRAVAERDAAALARADAEQGRTRMAERARIARELHDVVAHHVSMISVQAEAARLTTPGLPDQGRERLRQISATARDAMAELRRVLGVLREDGPAAPDRAPQPGLARLDELTGRALVTGGAVRVLVSGEPRPLPAGVDVSAYRILQEALTNVRRHAPGADVEVEVAYAARGVRLRVRDDGPGPPEGHGSGHGLLGMRERVTMAGGRLYAGPAEDGRGFLVDAELPLPRGVGEDWGGPGGRSAAPRGVGEDWGGPGGRSAAQPPRSTGTVPA